MRCDLQKIAGVLAYDECGQALLMALWRHGQMEKLRHACVGDFLSLACTLPLSNNGNRFQRMSSASIRHLVHHLDAHNLLPFPGLSLHAIYSVLGVEQTWLPLTVIESAVYGDTLYAEGR